MPDSEDMTLLQGERWYVVHTLPKREPMAKINLELQSFRTFMPLLDKRVRHARRVTDTKIALFPRYLFIALNLERDRWRSVNGTFGVASLVMEIDKPRPAPVGIVETLISSTQRSGLFAPRDSLAPGDHVTVLNGPFADRIGKVASLAGHERVAILLDLMGASRPITLARNQVLRVN